MKFVFSLFILSFTLFDRGSPVFTFSRDVDTWMYGDANRGGMLLNRYHDSYFNRRAVRSGPSTYALRQPGIQPSPDYLSQLHQADRRRQALLEVNDTPPQQNEVFYPQAPETPAVIPVEATELIEPLQAEAIPTPTEVTVPQIVETKIGDEEEIPASEPKKTINTKKQVKKPVEDDDDDYDEDEIYPRYHKIPTGAFFPMFFSSGGSLGGTTAIANAFSNGQGGAAKSDAIAYGTPQIIRKA